MKMISCLVGLGLAAASAMPAVAAQTYCQGNEANLATFQEMTEVLFNERDERQATRFYAPTVVSHDSDSGGPGSTVARESLQRMWAGSKVTYPDRKLVNDVIICSADLVVARVTMTGTMTGPMKGPKGEVAPTGKSFKTTAIDIYRFKDGKVVERWGNNDQVTFLRQVGLLGSLTEK